MEECLQEENKDAIASGDSDEERLEIMEKDQGHEIIFNNSASNRTPFEVSEGLITDRIISKKPSPMIPEEQSPNCAMDA